MLGLTVGTLLSLWGCLGKAPLKTIPPVPPEQAETNPLKDHLLGTWENMTKDKTKQLIFGPGGTLQFSGGLEYFNPGRWELDSEQHELILTFPQADDEKLQIFQLYVGDGVKAFDRRQQRITYAFDDQTWSLNVGGWVYSKPEAPVAPLPPEPVLK